MRLKSNLTRPAPGHALAIAFIVAADVYREYEIECVITSIMDGVHSETSLHYSGNAFDLRIKNIPAAIGASTIANEIRTRLNHHYDVILEKDHIHIEYQPRL